MKRINAPIQLIIDYKVDVSKKDLSDPIMTLSKANIPIESGIVNLADNGIAAKDIGAPSPDKEQIVITSKVNDLEVHPWDLAHAVFNSGEEFKFVEPDIWQEFTVDAKLPDNYSNVSAKSLGGTEKVDDVDPDWPPAKNLVWHLDTDFSQLRDARNAALAAGDYQIRIGHLDTGYTTHFAIPPQIRDNPLQRNFIDGENPLRALDIGSDGFMKQPYHGTGTCAILAGGEVTLETANGPFKEFLGAAHFAEVISCRISKSVVLFKTSAFAKALNYLTSLATNGTPVHVVSMSMGGAPTKAWANAVNAAYDAGITIVTAAGNNFSGLPTRHLVYPARFQRVIAACGVTYDKAPYYTDKINEMQGNYGPADKMKKALAAFTPNIPWASPETNSIQFSGAGTSSATPQIAAAAAIYYKVHHAALDALKPWQRVEAIRYALYSTARKDIKKGFGDYSRYFGNGILQAADALKQPVRTDLPRTPEDSCPWFPILNTLFKAVAPVPNEEEEARLDMLNTELWQMLYSYPELAAHIDGDAVDFDYISADKWDAFANAVMTHPGASNTLKAFIKTKYPTNL